MGGAGEGDGRIYLNTKKNNHQKVQEKQGRIKSFAVPLLAMKRLLVNIMF